jgi:hypothetical protein
MEKVDPAAREYNAYLKQVQEGKQAQYAYQRTEGVGLHQIVPIGPCHLAVQLCVLAIWKSSTVRCTASGFQIAAALI